MRVGVLAGNSVSLQRIAEQIAVVARDAGLDATVLPRTYNPYDIADLADEFVIVMPPVPTLAAPLMVLYRDLVVKFGKRVTWYGMLEGKIPPIAVKSWMRRDLTVTPCSKYTKAKLEEAGIRTTDAIHHGVLPEEIARARDLAADYARLLRARFGEKKILLTVSHSHPRKNLEGYAQALRILAEKRNDYVAYIITDEKGVEYFEGVPNAVAESTYGKLDRDTVLALLAASDLHVLPSAAEGFGLTVLEANALGTPALHVNLPSLLEFSDPSANFVVPAEDVVDVPSLDGIVYEFHLAAPAEMAGAISDALDAIGRKDGGWEERRRRARSVLLTHNAYLLYRQLLGVE